ncbi:MAG TPA: HEPN domain-containing protein [Leptospiraceae bacterium]|nr:HEPN domain-containing protein [Leptospiraceae bacterium]HMX33950.1 HEPN domain-containing protein [Leptospiraceae bacterium]HMY34227.1 HEPN domain-containing protein [Leptospiraceae bacterium]HMZ66752.1 HEPN domain-containing protein [Leptospiraceae bacterium]HNA09914.1 HEPN domain-containing protein [Leptospiraceae bacterium]
MSSNPEILAEMARAKKALKSAEVLLNQNLLEDCISRSYYAILHSSKAALLSKGISADSHEAIKNLFGMHLVKSGEIEKEYAFIFREEQDERLLADYDVNFVPEQEMVFRRVEDARDFVMRMEKFLGIA